MPCRRTTSLFPKPVDRNVLLVDWRDNPILPRTGYYTKRNQAVAYALIHNTGGDTDVLADNRYHRFEAKWDGKTPGGAPHIAYHFWIPADPIAFLKLHKISLNLANPPAAVIVFCNHLWERSWHGTAANDAAVGIATQGDGQKYPFSDAQLIALPWLLETYLPGQNVSIPRANVYGHGETTKVYGGGPNWSNNTVCPGEQRLPWVRAYRQGA